MRIVAVADTDSYVKWAAALLGTLDETWDAQLLVLETPVVVSDTQLSAALSRSGLARERVQRVDLDDLRSRLQGADAVLLAARGPLVRVLAREAAALAPRPVIVSGLPGISIPATRKALIYRTQCDLMVLHSHRERHEFAELARQQGIPQRFGLATLPFAHVADAGGAGTDLVFAAQAKVPAERADRARVARLLVRAADADPTRRVVVKLRATATEQQTHVERDAFPDLLADLGPLPPNLVMSTAPMHEALATADGLVTISSTAAIEAIARGIPVIAIDTFGVSPELINEVLADGGMTGDEEDVVARRYRHPAPEWRVANYFHPSGDDDWTIRLARLVRAREAGLLPERAPLRRRGGTLRDAWERKSVLGAHDHSMAGAAAVAIGRPARGAVRMWELSRRAIRGVPTRRLAAGSGPAAVPARGGHT